MLKILNDELEYNLDLLKYTTNQELIDLIQLDIRRIRKEIQNLTN